MPTYLYIYYTRGTRDDDKIIKLGVMFSPLNSVRRRLSASLLSLRRR